MSFARRQLRQRILEALARRAKTFRTRHDIWPLRVPAEPLLLDEVIAEARGADPNSLGIDDLKSRSLLTLEWRGAGSGGSSRWETWVLALPSGLNLYCDSIDDESRILASARRDAQGGGIDEFFLELLAASAGEDFGIEMAGGAPSIVRTTLADSGFLLDFFVDLFEISKIEASVRARLGGEAGNVPPEGDFRADVERWLQIVLRP
jgi:hypothetical protein